MAVCDLGKIRASILSDIEKSGQVYNEQWLDDALKDVTIVREQNQAAVNNRSDGKEFVNQSGGAIGADTVFGEIAALFGFRSNHYYDTNQDLESQPPNANTPITRSDYREGASKATAAARRSGLTTPTGTVTNSLIIRNWSQVKYADAIFAVTPITRKGESARRFNNPSDTSQVTEDTGSGGTAYAIEMGKDAGKPIYIFDDGQTNQWYEWNYKTSTWKPIKEGSPTLTKNYAGIGSRNITDTGKKAISDMFEAQFGKIARSTDVITDEMRNSDGILVIPGKSAEAKQKRANAHNIGAGVFGMRVFDAEMFNNTLNPDYHYGNPFGVTGLNTGASQPAMGTGEEVSVMFKEWLEGTAHQDVEPARREWILETINAGQLDGKKIIYFKEEKELTHAKVLRDFIKNRNEEQAPIVEAVVEKPQETTVNDTAEPTVDTTNYVVGNGQYSNPPVAEQGGEALDAAVEMAGPAPVHSPAIKVDTTVNLNALPSVVYGKGEYAYDAENDVLYSKKSGKEVWADKNKTQRKNIVTAIQNADVRGSLQEGAPIKLFSEFKLDNGLHITYNFKPEGKFSDGPLIPGTEGDTVSVKVVGTYKDSDMEYDVVEVTLSDGTVLTEQPSGTPFHITKYVNKDNGIKPFMTGAHAKANPDAVKEVTDGEVSEATVNVVNGKYTAKFDNSIRGSQQAQTGDYDENIKYNEDPATFSLDSSLLDIVQEMLDHEEKGALTGTYETNREHLKTMAKNIIKMYKDLGITADQMTMQDYLDASNKREDTFIKADSELNSRHIRIDLTGNQTFSTPLELFLHEVQHIMIEKALAADPKMKTKIRKLRKTAATQIPAYIEKAKLNTIYAELQTAEVAKVGRPLTKAELTKLERQARKEAKEAGKRPYEMFLTDKATPTSHEVEYAKKLYEYVFHNPTYPESEFLAYASTNMYMQEMLENVKQKDDTFGLFENEKTTNARGRTKKTLGYSLKDFVNRMIEVFNKIVTTAVTDNKSGKEAVNDIVMQLFQVSAQASKNSSLPAEPSGKFKKIYDKADEMTVNAMKLMTEGKKKKVRNSGKVSLVNEKTDSLSAWVDRVTDSKLTMGIKQTLIRNNIFTAVLRDTADPEIAWFYDMFRQSKYEVDSATQTLKHEAVVKLLGDMHNHEGLSIFMAKDPKTNKLDESIVQSLKKALLNIDYASITKNVKDLVPMLEDTSLAFNEIKKLSKGMDKEVVLAAKRLGMKLVTGVDTDKNGFINATEIQRHYKTQDAVADIDKIASLYALTQTGLEDRTNTIAAIAKNVGVIQNSMNVYYADRKTMRDQVFVGPQAILEEKGFHVKHKDTAQVQHIVKKSELVQLEKSGMKVINADKKSGLLTALEEATGEEYVLVAGTDLETAYTQGLINTVQIRAEGMSFRRVLFEAGLDQIEIVDVMTRMAKEKPKYDAIVAEENFMTPERSITGEIKDYRIKVSYADQEAHLGLNDNLAHVIANTSANLSHKEEAIRSNINSVHNMIAYAENNYAGNEDKFTILRATNPNERLKGKEYEYADKWNIIPDYARKEIERMTGKASIAIPNSLLVDFTGYKDASVTDFGIFESSPRIKRTVQILGKGWAELVGLAKKSIVTKMFSTIKNNTVSNMIVTMIRLRQPNPLKYMKEFTGIWEALNDFQATNREIIRLEIAQKAGEDVTQDRIDSLKRELEDNRAYSLFKDGQYSSILEDIDFDIYKDDGLITSQLDKLFTKLPKGTKNVTDVLFLTNKSWAYQKLVKLTQLNDIANRVMLLEGGVDLRETDKMFVNYSYLDNKWIKWANDNGFLMFTKYLERSLSAMGTFVKKNPLGVGLFLATREALGIDWLDTPLKGYFSPVDSIMNKIHGDDPMNTVKHGLFPFMFYGD